MCPKTRIHVLSSLAFLYNLTMRRVSKDMYSCSYFNAFTLLPTKRLMSKDISSIVQLLFSTVCQKTMSRDIVLIFIMVQYIFSTTCQETAKTLESRDLCLCSCSNTVSLQPAERLVSKIIVFMFTVQCLSSAAC